MPSFVREVSVGADTIDFDTHFLKLRIFVGHVAQLSRANESEIGRVEKEHGPFAVKFFLGNCFKGSLVESLDFEVRDFAIY